MAIVRVTHLTFGHVRDLKIVPAWKRFSFDFMGSLNARRKVQYLTTSLFVTLAATIPKVIMYNDGYVSKTRSTDFCEMMNALKTTVNSGITGEITLVPCIFTTSTKIVIIKKILVLEFGWNIF